MTKFELIEEIRSLNFTASVEFLSQFSEEELQEYLDHLMKVEINDLTACTPIVVPFH